MAIIKRLIVALSVVVAVAAAFPVFAQDAATVSAESGFGGVVCSLPYEDCTETGHVHYSKSTSSWTFLHKDANDPEYCWYRVTEYHYSCTKTWEKCRICEDCKIGPVTLPTVCTDYGPEKVKSDDCRLIRTETTTRRAECGRGS